MDNEKLKNEEISEEVKIIQKFFDQPLVPAISEKAEKIAPSANSNSQRQSEISRLKSKGWSVPEPFKDFTFGAPNAAQIP